MFADRGINLTYMNNDKLEYVFAVADHYDSNQWLQVDLGSPIRVVGVITHGRPTHYNQWVSSYKIRYGDSTSNLVTIQNQESRGDLVG